MIRVRGGKPVGGVKRIKLTKGDRARIAITDNGCGIDAAQIAKVFTPFFSTKAQGTGLGLPLSARLMRNQGGTLSLESAVGTGTRATIELPLSQPDSR